jgi:hypothetical protein
MAKGRIVQGTRRPRDASSKGRIVQGTPCPRDALSKGRLVQGTPCPRDETFGEASVGDFLSSHNNNDCIDVLILQKPDSALSRMKKTTHFIRRDY